MRTERGQGGGQVPGDIKKEQECGEAGAGGKRRAKQRRERELEREARRDGGLPTPPGLLRWAPGLSGPPGPSSPWCPL